MCCTGGSGGGTRMTRCGLFCGMAALAALTAALLGPAWLHTEERLPYLPRQLAGLVSVRFKLGLFRACPKIIKPANLTAHISTPACSTIRYKSLNDVNATELGFQRLEFTPIVVTKMRISTPFQVVAVALILAGTISALIGHCCSDHRTLVACGLFLLGGLSLGGGLIVLASALSEASWDLPQKFSFASSNKSANTSLPQYQYGWCLQLSGLALILSEVAALLTISGYMARFPTVEDMVRVMVPGAERKLREQRGLSSEYLVRSHQKSPGPTPCSGVSQPTKGPPRLADEGTSLLCKSAPDICASNPQSAISYVDKADLSHMLPAYPETKIIEPRFAGAGFPEKTDQNVVDSRLSGFVDKEGLIMDSRMLSESRQNVIAFAEAKEHPNCQEPPARFSDFPPPPPANGMSTEQQQQQQEQQLVQQQPPLAFADKEAHASDSLLDAPYGYESHYNSLAGQTVPITLKHQHHHQHYQANASAQYIYQNFGTIHSGMLRVAEPSVAANCSSQRSMTLQNPKRKSLAGPGHIAQNTFSTLECEKRRRGGGGGGAGSGPGIGEAPLSAGFCAGSAV
ncbi:PREDICTED: uncharacterized protein LOC105362104 [Ceratosolen solmsi marchali]|uniref:Uncharacterized protein LOC105362104 n=1 Tax=Ceratosolen solmsi marchali TaxID=326594 RepID=A0AAJ6YGQ7_9HYME|nr:PREDICTED: uncharacterized protein LOC105362104 [Ceratosolen solmsi marchali]